jgi:alpha-L-fucosidase 2
MYALQGAFYTVVCDVENLGNSDALFMIAAGTNAWLAQNLWQVWEYSNDERQLHEKIYPVIRAIGEFYQGLLKEDSQGRLISAPSGSPENAPKNRCIYTILSEMATFDIELLCELFSNLINVGKQCGETKQNIEGWREILRKLPMPTINEEGRLLEWLDVDHEVHDPGHRHRSHLVGICPGQRITHETTPDYSVAVEKALNLRHSFGGKGSCTLDVASDAQIYARLYEPAKAVGKIRDIVTNHAMGNLMMCLCDWRPESGLRWFEDRRVFQIEASFGTMAAISELFVQDMGGLIRLLPALPEECPSGEVKGLLCRGGFEVDVKWQDKKLLEAKITSLRGNQCRVKSMTTLGELAVLCNGQNVETRSENGIKMFATGKGMQYIITGK